MDTYNKSQQKTSKIEDFLTAIEQEEPADDVLVSEIESGETAYQELFSWTRLR